MVTDHPKTPECLWCGRRGDGMKEMKRCYATSPLRFECVDRAACDKRIKSKLLVAGVATKEQDVKDPADDIHEALGRDQVVAVVRVLLRSFDAREHQRARAAQGRAAAPGAPACCAHGNPDPPIGVGPAEKNMEETPILSQSICYTDERGATFAATITKVLDGGTVNLIAFDDGTGALGAATHVFTSVGRAETPGAPGTWAYPYEMLDDDYEIVEKTPGPLADEIQDGQFGRVGPPAGEPAK